MDIEKLAKLVDALAAEVLALVEAQNGSSDAIKAAAARIKMLRMQITGGA